MKAAVFVPSAGKWTTATPSIQAHSDSGMANQKYWNGFRDGYVCGILVLLVFGSAIAWKRR